MTRNIKQWHCPLLIWYNLQWRNSSPCSTIHFYHFQMQCQTSRMGKIKKVRCFHMWHVCCSLYAHIEKYTYVLEVTVYNAVLTVPDSSVKLMKLQDSFSYWTHSFHSCSQDRLLPTEFLSILRNNRHKIELWSHLSILLCFYYSFIIPKVY